MQVRNIQNIAPSLTDKSIKIYYEHVMMKPTKIQESQYTYEYPRHWVEYVGGEKAIEIRQVRSIPAGRTILLKNFNVLRYNDETKKQDSFPVAVYVNLDTGDDMKVFNTKLQTVVREQLTAEGHPLPSEVSIAYNFETNSIDFKVISAKKSGFTFNEADVYSNENFKAIEWLDNDDCFKKIFKFSDSKMSIDDLRGMLPSTFTVEGSAGLLTRLSIGGIWSRENIVIKSSISEFAEESILCLSNYMYSPPKHYSITNFVSKFNIRLVEPSSMKDVVLPKDGKDGLIIEMILIAY
ncbi:hypothetical protein TVAG_220500 [Trichomonas vaginalis G3]|uniref:Uncharacterized protein n=1 Tax=Trichomonas vaginalis (strain ATCC PRA-98 / G3) TaxID=412133 RepID=A2GBH2_TRIV3|nr:hypothetical protein TVAG_220500 [Trichomonas vaginalis G3]|eukprot:XP_001298425.1 hypothetical protein [Trichomonas vaginalis G3]